MSTLFVACWVIFHAFLSYADFFKIIFFQTIFFRNTIRVSNGLDPDQDRLSVGPDLSYQQTTKVTATGQELTLYILMCSSFWFDTANLGWSIIYIEGSQVVISKSNCFCSFLKITFV